MTIAGSLMKMQLPQLANAPRSKAAVTAAGCCEGLSQCSEAEDCGCGQGRLLLHGLRREKSSLVAVRLGHTVRLVASCLALAVAAHLKPRF
jgi:hypothetical protein